MALPKEKLTVAVIGAGYWGSNLIRALHEHPRIHLSTVCDSNEERRKDINARYPTTTVVGNSHSLWQDPTIQAIVIASPTDTHFAFAKMALESGKHVFVEKPMATSSPDCLELIRLAKMTSRKLMVGHIFLYHPAVQYVHNLIERNELGEIIYISCQRVNLGPVRNDVNVLWDLGPHDISICNFWLGNQSMNGQALGLRHLTSSREDVVFASLIYPGNTLVSVHLSWLDPVKIRRITVVGTRRAVLFDDLDPVGPIHIFDKKTTSIGSLLANSIQCFKTPLQGGDLLVPKLPVLEPLSKECDEFVRWILDEEKTISDGTTGWQVVRALETLSRSLNASTAGSLFEAAISPESIDSLGFNVDS